MRTRDRRDKEMAQVWFPRQSKQSTPVARLEAHTYCSHSHSQPPCGGYVTISMSTVLNSPSREGQDDLL